MVDSRSVWPPPEKRRWWLPRVIVGGSGQYLGATGSMMVEPNADGSEWQKTIEIVGGGAG